MWFGPLALNFYAAIKRHEGTTGRTREKKMKKTKRGEEEGQEVASGEAAPEVSGGGLGVETK